MAVVYLIRAAEGMKPVKRFADAYRKNLAHFDHDLILVYKGFPGDVAPEEISSLFKEFPVKNHFVEDVGYDLTAYFTVFKRLDHQYFFFLNTFSRFRRSGWLKIIMDQLQDPTVGIVGCTGSYEALGAEGFDPYPNVHVRSNAFAMSRAVLEKIHFPEIKEKMDAHLFESGKKGLTAQVRAMSLKTVLVGANGKVYEPETWWKSETFRQKEQENRLVSDNQTDLYLKSDEATRKFLSERAWADKSRLS